MVCCVLGALIISQILAIWRDRRRIAIYACGLLISTGILGWQIDAHAHHIRQFVADAQAFMRDEDPAVVALQRSGFDCSNDNNSQREIRSLAASMPRAGHGTRAID